MTTEELKKEAEEYGIDLCAYCRECEGEKPCQHKLDAMHGYQDGLKEREKRIVDLEKENAELKEQISTKDILIKELQEQKVYWKESSFDWRHKFFKLDKVKRLIKKDKQLAQAKVIIKRFSAIRKTPYLEGEEELFAEAEQFLKDSEGKE